MNTNIQPCCLGSIFLGLFSGSRESKRNSGNSQFVFLVQKHPPDMLFLYFLFFLRYVDSAPAWGKQLQADLPSGTSIVTFTARSPISNHTSSCRIVIRVRGKSLPNRPHVVILALSFLEVHKSGAYEKNQRDDCS